MHTQVRKWENKIAICIPEELAAQAYLEEGMELEIQVVDGKVIITPIIKKYELSELLAGVTPENLHDEIDTGDLVGREAW
jgi:antitoxin MazE